MPACPKRLSSGAWVLAVALTPACATEAPTAPASAVVQAPPEVAAALNSVTGVVRGRVPPSTRLGPGHTPLSGAAVIVTAGAATGRSTRTASDGTFTLTIPAGAFALQFTHPGYEPSTSADLTAGPPISLGNIMLETAPWVLTGLVTDSVGNPVPEADITIRPGDAFSTTYGAIRSDAAGRYRFASSRPHWDFVLVAANRTGYVPSLTQRASCCHPGGDTTYDLSLVRVVSVTPTAPTALRIGESIELPPSAVAFDDGTSRNIFLLPTSSAPSVVDVSRSDFWYAMRGVSAGIATLTFDHHGVATPIQVRVSP